MASSMSQGAFVPSPFIRWVLPSQPLQFFRADGKDYLACADGIYHLNQELGNGDTNEDMDTGDDSPDLFGVSDIGKSISSSLHYKLK